MKEHLKTILVSFAAFLLVGCTEEYVTEERTMPKTDSPKVEKAINELNQFLQTMEIQTTRNGNAFTVDDVQYVTRNMSTTRSAFEVENNVLPDTILYLVNFGDETDNSGYAVLDATERSGAIILAVVENGYVSPEDFLFDTTPVDEEEFPNFEFYDPIEDDYYVGDEGAMANQFLYFATVIAPDETPGISGSGTITDWRPTKQVGPMIETCWHQNPPLNKYCPTNNKGVNKKVGCVAVAVGHILAYHGYPQEGLSIDGVDCDWEDMRSVANKNNYFRINEAEKTEQVAKLLADIGDGCNMLYGTEQSFAFPNAAKRCLKNKFGYTNAKRHVVYDEAKIIEMLNNDCPVFLAAVSGVAKGHAWVIDGYKKYTRYSNGEQQNKYYMHCCWGWMRGQCNGYYLSKVFDLRNGAIELENKDTPGTKERDYDMLYRMITYDKPNQ